MKKIMAVLMIIILMLAVVGCQGSSTTEGRQKEFRHEMGWSIQYPASWERVEADFIQETSTGKTLQFTVGEGTKEDLEDWLDSEIMRKLLADEADNTMIEPVTIEEVDGKFIYRYTLQSKGDNRTHVLKNTIYFDGQQWIDFHTALPPMTANEYESIVASFTF